MGGPSFFYEDEVFRVGKHGELEFGMVTENWEMYSSDDDESADPDKVLPGQVAVSWHPKGKDEVLQESKVKLSDRSLMPGDVVRRLIAGKDTQRGYCRNVRVLAAVQVIGSKKVIPSVLASDLQPVQKLQPEVAVYLDSWIGVIRDIRHKLSLRFADNSQCTIDSYGILDNFEDVRRGADGFGSGEVFYPGQKLRGPFRFIRDGEWTHMSEDLKRSKDRKMVTAVVTHIEPTSITVTWQWQTPQSGGEKSDSLRAPPPDLIAQADLDRVKILNLFEYCTVQLGDISFFTPSNKESLIDKQEWKKNATAQILKGTESNPGLALAAVSSKPSLKDLNNEPSSDTQNEGKSEDDHKIMTDIKDGVSKLSQMICKKAPKLSTRSLRKRKLKKAKPQTSQLNLVPGAQIVVETLHTQSVVDVVWQDGVIEEGMLSVDLYPIHHLDDHEFFPGDFITRADSTDFRRYGVIQNMDHNGRVALVKWFEAYTFDGEQRPKELDVTEMSVYDIKDHPDFRFRPGTIVIRVANSLPDQAAAGQILDNYPDGMVRVWWANGVMNSCWPQDLFRLGDYDSDEGEIWDDAGQVSDGEDEDANSDSSWETEIEEEVPDADTSNQRYVNIGTHIEHIQTSLVGIRAMLISSTPAEQTTPASPLSLNSPSIDKRVIVKKLLQIYKDSQYLDKMMSTKFFDEEFLKEWLKKLEGTFKSSRISDQLKRLFELPTEFPDYKNGETGLKIPFPEEKPSEVFDDGSQEIQIEFLSELCTVILNKLLLAHADFERRFGSKKADDLPDLVEMNETNLEKVEEPGESNELKEAEALKGKLEEEEQEKNTKEEILKEIKVKGHNFALVDSVPNTHRFRLSPQPQNMKVFLKGVQKEIALLREYLPDGILVKGYEDRMDLFSVMICGPEKTPYEDGIFLFDIQLPPTYPSAPPLVHYVSFCPDRLNPNLYECGKVCVSLLGTWTGKGTEVWTNSSSLLQVLVSIQGLILVQEPYFNEAGYERQRGSQQGEENSRMYNEMVLIKLVQSMSRMLNNLHSPFEKEIVSHMQVHGSRLVTRCNGWLDLSEKMSQSEQTDLAESPVFSLLPVSKGFSITLKSTLGNFSKLCSSQALSDGS